ncbi:MAG: hypothetical protein ABEK50_09100, partial [bacterium]
METDHEAESMNQPNHVEAGTPSEGHRDDGKGSGGMNDHGDHDDSGHGHDHTVSPDENFWTSRETLVSMGAGILFFTGLAFEFVFVNPTLTQVVGTPLTPTRVLF